MSEQWKLAPLVPAEQMLDAVEGDSYTFATGDEEWIGCVSRDMAEEIYTNMLAAAPQPPALGGESIQRYDISGFGGGMVEADDGAFVHAEDALAREARLQVEVNRLTGLNKGSDEMRMDLKGEVDRLKTAFADSQEQLVTRGKRNAELEGLLRGFTECPWNVELATIPKAGVDAAPAQVVGTMHISLLRLRQARAALAEDKCCAPTCPKCIGKESALAEGKEHE